MTLYYLKEASEDQWVTQMDFLDTATSQISHTNWDAMSQGQVCQPLAQWGNVNTMVASFCSSPHINCNYEVSPGVSLKQALNNLFGQLAIASGHKFDRVE